MYSLSRSTPPRCAAYIIYRFKIKYNNNIKELDTTLRYLIKNELTTRERIYLDIRKRYNIELDNN